MVWGFGSLAGGPGMSLFQYPKRHGRAKEMPIPGESQRIHEKIVWRLNSNKDWKKRTLILTKEDLLVGLDGHKFVIEKIPLVTI